MRLWCGVTLLLLLAVPVIGAGTPSDLNQALAGLQGAKSKEDAAAPLAFILAHAQEAPSPHLLIASAAAMQSKQLPDAAFLFYAAQLRARSDFARFPPTEKGGDSPGVLLAAMTQQVGAVINPAILREPKSFAQVVARISKWSIVTPSSYDPTWAYTATNPQAGAKEFEVQRAGFVKHFGGLSTLLNDPHYFAAFRTVQDYNLGATAHDAPHLEAKNKAEATMLSIEKKMNIEGLYNHK